MDSGPILEVPPLSLDGEDQYTFAEWWQVTHREVSSAELMWTSWDSPYRRTLFAALDSLPAVTSVYEIGCGSGPNLRLLRAECPALRLGGMDCVPEFAAFASERLGTPIDCGTLPDVPDGDWDVTVSMYTCAYLLTEPLMQTLRRLTQTSKYLVLVEPVAGISPYPDETILYRPLGIFDLVHNYVRKLAQTGWGVRGGFSFDVGLAGSCNAVLVAERSPK